MQSDDLRGLRRKGVRTLAILMWCFTALLTVSAWLAGGGWLFPLTGAILAALPTYFAIKPSDGAGERIMLGATVPLYPALLLAQHLGSAWQIDIHMTFFAALACLAVLCDWRPVVAGTLVTALHHIGADLAIPAWIFPNGADFARVLLHAVIVLAEAAVLIKLAVQMETMIVAQAQARASATALERKAMEEQQRLSEEQRSVLDQVGTALDALAAGKVGHRIRDGFPVAYQSLADSFNAAIATLDQTLGQIAAVAGDIDNGAGELRQAADDMAMRTERQAATLQEAATAMGRVTMAVGSNAEGASRVDALVDQARMQAQSSENVVHQAVDAMSALQRTSVEIADIVTLVDNIAFQTNLLALNAGVEAARAGDAGQGFAVVAAEVRALAQRSAEAAKDIKQRVGDSETMVKSCGELVSQTGEALQNIFKHIGEISGLASTISASANQQAGILREVNLAVTELDEVTQQNAAMVEQSTAAARNLAAAAGLLTNRVEIFETSNTVDRGTAALARAA